MEFRLEIGIRKTVILELENFRHLPLQQAERINVGGQVTAIA